MTLIERLRRLHDRLEMEGRYTDANIVWFAWSAIVSDERLAQSEVPDEGGEGPEEVHSQGA